MKKIIAIICVYMLILSCLCACGEPEEQPPAQPTVNEDVSDAEAENGQTDENLQPDENEQPADSADSTEAKIANEMFAGTYWKAVTWEITDGENDEIPEEDWKVDLFLYPDGGSRLRSVVYDSYTEGAAPFADGAWYVDSAKNVLCILSEGGYEMIYGEYIDGKLYVEFAGRQICFEQSRMPKAGVQWCMADLEGNWKLETVEIEGYAYDADEMGVYGSLCFSKDYLGLSADYVHGDTAGNEESFWTVPVEYHDYALYDGCPNETWSAQIIATTTSDGLPVEYHLTLTDRNTLVMMVFTYFAEDEYPAVSVSTYSYQGNGSAG